MLYKGVVVVYGNQANEYVLIQFQFFSLSLSLFLGGPLTSNLVRNILNMPIEIDPHHGGNRGRRDEISWWRSA